MKVPVLLVALAMGGCVAAPNGSSTPDESNSRPVGSVGSVEPGSPTSLPQRDSLPADFPVMPGAASAPMPVDDPGLIGLWESDKVGSAAYDFYVAALPAAGYGIVGLYPGDEVALIRFGLPGGGIWQVVVRPAAPGRVAIEVRLDRP